MNSIQRVLGFRFDNLASLLLRQGRLRIAMILMIGAILGHGSAWAANDASFTTQTALSNMTVGEPYAFSVTMKNVGTASWTTSGGYALVLQNPSGWSLSSIANTVAVAVNGSRVFSGTITPPSTPGTYTFQWCMAQSGVVFGACSTPLTIQVAARAPDATFSAQTTFTTMTTATRAITVTMKNTGNTTWKTGKVFLGTQNPQDNMTWGINRLQLSTATVAPNASGIFSGTITAPTSNYYDLQWRALDDSGAYFGDPTPNQNIAVAGGAPVLNIISPTPGMQVVNNGGVVDVPIRATATPMGIATISKILIYGKDVNGTPTTIYESAGPEFEYVYHRTGVAATATSMGVFIQTVDSFGKKSPETTASVGLLSDNSTYVSGTVPTQMVPGLPYEFDVVFRNTGTIAWNPQTVSLQPYSASTSDNWGDFAFQLETPVAIGESGTFHVKLTAPATEGTYPLWLRLNESTRSQFGATLSRSVVVARQPPVVAMIAPVTGLSVDVPTAATGTVRVQGNAQPGINAAISMIEVLDGTTVIASVNSNTIDQDVELAVGTHTIKLRATDNWKETALSTVATVTVKGNNAAYVSQSVPAKMEVGKAYTATVSMRNSGNKPWTAATGYALGSQNPANNAIWRDSRVSSNTTVAAGGTITYSLPVVAPTVPGKYNFQWQMLQEGTEWFGAMTPNVEVTVNPVAPYAERLTMPAIGDQFIAVNGKADVRLQGVATPGDGAAISKLEVLDGATVIATGDSATIDTVVQLAPGAHTLKLRATDNFSQVYTATLTTAITVFSNNATAVSRTAPTSMAGGSQSQVTVVMRNAGTSTWTPEDGYALGPVPDDHTWVAQYVPVDGVVAPGANATFTFNVTAPTSPSAYPFQWQMLRQNKSGVAMEWFGAKSTIQSISVTGDAPTVSMQRPVDGVSYASTTGTTVSVPVVAVGMPDSPATISRMEVLDGTTVKYTLNNSAQLNINVALAPGQHVLQVRATDSVGLTGLSDTATVNVTAPPPTAAISAPLAGAAVVAAASGQASVVVKGTAAVFNGATLAAVELMEGDTVLQTGKTAAVSMTQAFAPGVHSIKLRVTDNTGQKVDSAVVQFTVYQQVSGNAAMFIGQAVPPVIRTAQPYSVTVNMLNTGSTTWTEATQFRLGSANPQDNRTWNSTGRAYLAASVAPGAIAKFTIPVTAPQKAGLYNFQWRMVQDGTGWFGDMTENLPITVADGAGPGVTLNVTPTNVRMAGTTPVTLTFSASAIEAGRKITRLDVLVDKGSGYAATAVKSATGATATLALNFTTTATAGVYKYKARATDDLGVQTDTDNVIVNIADSTVLGSISGVRIEPDNKPVLVGWLCQPGVSTALAYEVLLDAPTPAAGGTQLTTGVANVSGEADDASVQSACGTPGVSHSFKVDLSGTSPGALRKMALRSAVAAADTPDTNAYAGRALYVHALNLGTAPAVLPCADNSCTMPGSMRIALATPVDGATVKAPLFVRTVVSGTSDPVDEVAIAVDGNWVTAQPDTAANAYFANFADLQPRAAPYLVQSRVRQGNTTLYSAFNQVTIIASPVTTLSLTGPANGAKLAVGTPVTLSATVGGTGTGPTSVKFYANGKLIGDAIKADTVWSRQWTPATEELVMLQALGYDASGQQLAASTPVSVTISANGDGTLIPVAITPPYLGNTDAGTLPGALSAGVSGTAEYHMPLTVPPGTANMAPELSLDYASSGTNGILGLGWTLGGTSSIHRCGKTIAQDGVNNRIAFSTSDRLCLDGQRLVLVNLPLNDDNYWADGAEFRTEPESFARITALGSYSNGTRSFRVDNKNGKIMTFGTTPDSVDRAVVGPILDGAGVAVQPAAKSGPLSWALDAITDRVGNFIRFSYEQDATTGEHHPLWVRYGGAGLPAHAAVQFLYKPREDSWKRYVDEARDDLRHRIEEIKTYVGTDLSGDVSAAGTMVHDYTLSYELSPTSGRSLLSKVQACARNPQTLKMECLPETLFGWGKPDPGKTPGWESKGIWPGAPILTTWNQANKYGANHADYFAFQDFENHGLTDVLEKRIASAGAPQGQGYGFGDANTPGTLASSYRYFHNNGRGFDQYTYRLDTSESFAVLNIGDFDGDGAPDLLVATSGVSKICLSPLGKPGALGQPGGEIIFTCQANLAVTGANLVRKLPYVIDVVGDGRAAIYGPLLLGGMSAPFCSGEQCVTDNNPPLTVLAYSNTDLGSTDVTIQRYVSFDETVDFTGSGKSSDVRFSQPVFLDQIVKEEGQTMHIQKWLNLTPQINITSFHLPAVAATENIAPYVYPGFSPPSVTTQWPYGFDKPSDSGGVSADFNGSGYQGLLFGYLEYRYVGFSRLYNKALTTLCLSTGRSLDCGVRQQYSGANYQAIRAVDDFVGDGAPGILVETMNYPVDLAPQGTGQLQMCRVTGDDTTAATGSDSNMRCQAWSGVTVPRAAPNLLEDQYYFMDLLGTGRKQLVLYHSGTADAGNNYHEDGRWEVFAPVDVAVAGQALDRLVQVTNGLGAVSRVEYKDGLTDGVVLASVPSSLSYPQHLTRTPGKVVSRLILSNVPGSDRSFSYSYQNQAIDMWGRGLLGYAKVNMVDEQTGIATTTTYRQDWPYKGMVVSAVASRGTCVVSDTENQLDALSFTHGYGAVTVFPNVKKSTVSRHDVDDSCSSLGSSSTTYGYTDGFGNLNEQTIEVSDGTKSFISKVSTVFRNDNQAWLLGLATSVASTKTNADSESVTRTTAYDYDPVTGLLSKETAEPDTAQYTLTTTYDRSGNAFGLVNAVSQTWTDPAGKSSEYWNNLPACVTAGKRTLTSITYDANGRFPRTVTNALCQVSEFAYDPFTGRPVTHIDPNHLTTSWEVDGFGRVTKEVAVDGNETRTYRKRCADGCGIGAAAVSVSDVFHGASRIKVPQMAYTDSNGHLLRTQTWGFDGTSIVADTRYDELGRVYETDQPHFEGATAYLASRQFYDIQNRVVKSVTLDENGRELNTVTDYHGLTVTLTNPLNQKREETHNVIGQLTQVKDAKDGITQFSYEPFGALGTTTDPMGNVIKVLYDRLGRRTSMQDPDLGLIEYRVDPLGQNWAQISPAQRAAGKSTTFVYDLLGRMTARYETDLESHWQFDTAENGIGQLAEAYTMAGDLKDYDRLQSYDSKGRLSSTIQRVYATSFSSQIGYDDWGRVATQTYQRATDTAKSFDLRYGKTGYLAGIERSGLALWQVGELDAALRLTTSVLGNGLTQIRNLDKYTGRLMDSSLQPVDGAARLTEAYHYDVLGNVLHRTQKWDAGGFDEDFTYDELNRLWTSTVGQTLTYKYDAAGNMLSKTGVGNGSYRYLSGGKGQGHAVQSIDGLGGGCRSGVDGGFLYDVNGNQTCAPGRKASWTSFDMPLQLDKGGVTANFVYGPEHQRTRQDRSDGSSVIYAGAQEVEISSTRQVTVKTYWPGGVGVEIDRPGATTSELRWMHVDRLGSPLALTDEAGLLRDKLEYDAWGKRRNIDDNQTTPDGLAGTVDNRGFTGHEMLDQLDLVHMNGRVYDPLTGRFLSGDPLVQDPTNGQSYNRYAYVLNNPTNLTDPTGFTCEAPQNGGSCPGESKKTTVTGSNIAVTAEEAAVLAQMFGVQGPAPMQKNQKADPKNKNPNDAGNQSDSAKSANNSQRTFSERMEYGNANSGDPVIRDIGHFEDAPRKYATADQMMSGWIDFNFVSSLLKDAGVSSGKAEGIGFVAMMVGNPKQLISKGAQKAVAYSVFFETQIAKNGVGTRAAHFADANRSLAEALAKDPEFAAMAEKLGIQIPDRLGQSPANWTWHHVPDQPGVLQLVPRDQHQGSFWQSILHPDRVGGFKIWGGEY